MRDSAASSLGLDENVAVLGIQHTLADELLGDGDGDVIGHTQVGQVVQEPGEVTAGRGSEAAPRMGQSPLCSPSWQHQLPGTRSLLLLLPFQSLELGLRTTPGEGQPVGITLGLTAEGQRKGRPGEERYSKYLTGSLRALTHLLKKVLGASHCTGSQHSYC